jgi:predicted metal-binding membrane protein
MTEAARQRMEVRVPLLFASVAAWIALFINERHTAPSCAMAGMGAPSWPVRLLGWTLMLIAMMAPGLVAPLRHVLDRSFTRQRAFSVFLFLTGYVAIWMAVGELLLVLSDRLDRVFPLWAPQVFGFAVALAWQCSPLKQYCLNRCHAQPELAAFVPAACRDSLRFGVTQGIGCAGSCWALMLVPMLLPTGHLLAMAGAMIWFLGERFERASKPCWRWRGPGHALQIASAQMQLRMKQLTVTSRDLISDVSR